eukprot:g1497.t1
MVPDAPASSTGKGRSRAEKNAAKRKRKRARVASTHGGAGSMQPDPNDGGGDASPRSTTSSHHDSCEPTGESLAPGKPKRGEKKKRRLVATVSAAESTAQAATSAQPCRRERSNDNNIGNNSNPQQQHDQPHTKKTEEKKNQKKKKKKKKKKKSSLPHPPPTTPADTTAGAAADDAAAPSPSDGHTPSGGRSPTSRRDAVERALGTALEGARKKHRQDIGKGRPLVGWDIGAFSNFVFQKLAAVKHASKGWSGEEEEEEEAGEEGHQVAVASAVAAVTAVAEREHAGQVSVAQFEALVRAEAAGFWARRRAVSLLQRALGEEQAGNLDAAEAGCAACLAAWPGCASGHLKMAKILRARGLSRQRAVKDVEFHLRQALGSASKPEAGEEAQEVAQAAAEGLSLLLCQEGRDKEAAKVLKRRGFRYRLATSVLRYPPPSLAKEISSGSAAAGGVKAAERGGAEGAPLATTTSGGKGSGSNSSDASEFVAAFDDALPGGMLSHLQEAFGSRSRFWSEHGYNSETGTPGYFSYIHPLGKKPTTSIEQVINRVRTLAERSFPEVKEAKFVEWWAHRRPHSSGHQMHFDSDNEGRGGVRNPIVSVVVYVTGDVGGPTLVTTQRLTSKRLADRGWIVHPRVNRVCMFDGGVLHGVIPGRGVPPAAVGASSAGTRQEGDDGRYEANASGSGGGGGRGGSVRGAEEKGRSGMRVTWMVAFWRDIQARPRPAPPEAPPQAFAARERERPRQEAAAKGGETRSGRRQTPPSGAGAAQPFPAVPPPDCGGTAPSWPALFRKKPEGWGDEADGDGGGGCGGGGSGAGGVPVTPVPIPQVWEDVDAAENRLAGRGVRRLKRLPESPRPPPPPQDGLRRRIASWAGQEDRPPVAQESWWFPVQPPQHQHQHHHHHPAARADSSDTASLSSRGRCDSGGSTPGDGNYGEGVGGSSSAATPTTVVLPGSSSSSSNSGGGGGGGGGRRTRKRDWFKVLLAARNLATVVYAISYTTTLPVLPFMVNRLIYPREPDGADDAGSEGVPEAWRGMAYGLVMSGYYLTKMISAPWIGFLSDRMGRRQALVVTLLGGALSFQVTKMWGQYSIQGLILCRLLMGCFAANGALMHAYIRDTVPPEWQSSAFSQHSASWGCAYLAAPALIAWAGDSADAILTVATVTMIVSAAIVEITFVDTRPEGHRTQRMSRVVSDYLLEGASNLAEVAIEGARDLAEVGKKVSGMDLAEYFNGGREKDASPPPLPTPPSHPDRVVGELGLRDSGGGRGEIGGGGGGLGGAGGEGLRHRNVTGGGGGGSTVSEAAGGVETNGFAGPGAGAAAGREAAGEAAFDVPPDAVVGVNGVGEPGATAGGGGGGGKGEGGKGGGKDVGEDDRPRAGSMSTSALVGVFKGMMKERLVLVTFVLQLLRPAQDLAPLVALKFSGGASVLAGITSSRSLCRVLVPMTPLIPWLVRLAGGHSSAGAAAKMGGDRAVAAFMCVLMAGLVACVPAVDSLRDLHHLMAVKGLCYIVRESTAGAVMARAAGTASVGAFFGWQHCIKGFQGTFSHFLTGWLSGYSISLPYYVVAFCDLLYAFAYLYI